MAKHKRGIIKKASKNEQILPHIRPTQIRFSCSQEKSIYMSIERKDCDKNARKWWVKSENKRTKAEAKIFGQKIIKMWNHKPIHFVKRNTKHIVKIQIVLRWILRNFKELTVSNRITCLSPSNLTAQLIGVMTKR